MTKQVWLQRCIILAIKIKEYINKISNGDDRKIKILVAVGLIGIVLIFASEFLNNDVKQSDISSNSGEFDYEQYTASLEEKLEDVISSIDGVGRCKIMITLENSNESVYATDNELKSDENSVNQKDEYVLYETDNGETPVLIKEYLPQVQGVTVICDGGDNRQIQEKIINSVTALFNIPTSRVSVSKIKK